MIKKNRNADTVWLDFCKRLTKGRPVPTVFKGNRLTVWSRIEKWALAWPADVRTESAVYTGIGLIFINHRDENKSIGTTVVIARETELEHFFLRVPIIRARRAAYNRLRKQGYQF